MSKILIGQAIPRKPAKNALFIFSDREGREPEIFIFSSIAQGMTTLDEYASSLRPTHYEETRHQLLDAGLPLESAEVPRIISGNSAGNIAYVLSHLTEVDVLAEEENEEDRRFVSILCPRQARVLPLNAIAAVRDKDGSRMFVVHSKQQMREQVICGMSFNSKERLALQQVLARSILPTTASEPMMCVDDFSAKCVIRGFIEQERRAKLN